MRLRIAALSALALVALPASASASCRSKVADEARVVERSRTAVVYRVRDATPGFEQSKWYGCELRTGKLRQLPKGGEFAHVSHITLAGRYVAYSEWEEDPAGSEISEEVHVDDLRTGARRDMAASHEGYEAGVNVIVRSLVLKPNSSLAWIVSRRNSLEPPVLEVNAVEAERGGRRTRLDHGTAIRPRSLALSDNRRTIYWRNGDQVRSARLR